jgi:hypothetical protein
MSPMNPRLLRPTGGRFTPRSISGLVLWLDGANDSSITLNGSTVSEWRDLSGFGRHCANPTGGNQPTRVTNGIGLDTTRSLYGNAGWTADQFTCFVAADINLSAGQSGNFARLFTQRFFSTNADWNSNPAFIPLVRFSNSNFGVAATNLSNGSHSVTAGSNPRPCVYVVTKATGATGAITIRLNGTTSATGNAGSTTGTTAALQYAVGMEINSTGVTNTSGGSRGEVYGVAAYSRLLSEAEITALTRLFGQQYGITVA